MLNINNDVYFEDCYADDVNQISFEVSSSDALIDCINKMRAKKGYNDLVNVDNDNDVYYTYYLVAELKKQEITLFAQCNHGERDDYMYYYIPLTSKDKEDLKWKMVKYLSEV